MPTRIRFLFSAMMLAFFFIAAVPLYQELTRQPDIWWTPRGTLVPLGESANRVEIYVGGRLLSERIQAGQLRIVEGTGTRGVAWSDIGLRFNNWDRIRVVRLPVLLASAAACGAALLMLVLILTGRLAYRGERAAVA